jgi:hypothetical protein
MLEEAVGLYNSGLSLTAVGVRLGYSCSTIHRLFVEHGVPRRRSSEYLRGKQSHNRKYACDAHFFDSIRGEAQAYYLGVLLADGNMTKSSKGVVVYSKDYELVECFKQALNATNPIDTIERGPYRGYEIRIFDCGLYQALQAHGCVPCKSHTVKFPNVPESLTRHLIRGYFDGDGGVRRDNRNYIRMSFRGTHDMLSAIREILTIQVGTNLNKISLDGGIHRIFYNGTPICTRVADFMYKDASVFLSRKHALIYGRR